MPDGEDARLRALALTGAASLRTAGQWESWLRHAERFTYLGFANTMLIWAQRPDATEVRDYTGWQNAGRQVTRDEHGIQLLTKQGVRTVFDISQTEGAAVSPRRPRPSPSDVWSILSDLALRAGYRVETAGRLDEPVTWRSQRVIKAPARDLTGLAEQIGHVLVYDDQHACDTLQGKVEALSAAFLIAVRLSLDTTEFVFPNVTSWAGADPRAHPEQAVTRTGVRVLRAASTAFRCIDAAIPQPAATHVARPARVRRTPADKVQARIQEDATRFFTARLAGTSVPNYLATRGLDADALKRWRIGYAPAGWTALTNYLRERGYSDQDLEASGLCKQSRRGSLIDVFRDRAMFPVRAPSGQVLGFTGRAAPGVADGVPKYINNTGTVLYSKGKVLFGLPDARDTLPVITEGPIDAIAVTRCGGRYGGVAPCGTALTRDQVSALVRAAPGADQIIVLFDGDDAGRRAAVKAYELLRYAVAQPLTAALPDGHDPASLARERGPQALAQILASEVFPLADLVTDECIAKFDRQLEFTDGQFNALDAVSMRIARMAVPEVARQVQRVADRIGLPAETVTAAVTEAIPKTLAAQAITRGPSPPRRSASRPAFRGR
jgi:DNA primase